jgi:hypothetical protein
MCHVSGFEAVLAAIVRDETQVVTPTHDKEMLLFAIQKYKVSSDFTRVLQP